MKNSEDVAKYQSKNPIKQFLIKRFLKTIALEIKKLEVKSVIDLGCGEGFVEEYLLKEGLKIEIVGIDKNKKAIRQARGRNPNGEFIQGDIFSLNFKDKQFDLVLMLEVLEHLREPQKALLKAKRLAKMAIFSVPWEPWFSLLSFLSMKYLTKWGRHPGHINYFSKNNFKKLISKSFYYSEIKSSFPWLIAVCRN